MSSVITPSSHVQNLTSSQSSSPDRDQSPEHPSVKPAIPSLYATPPPIKDTLSTETSVSQDETVQECLPYLAGTADPSKTQSNFASCGVPRLEREDHIEFLKDHLQDAEYIAYDAARPWVVYWCLAGLSLLGEDVESWQERSVSALLRY